MELPFVEYDLATDTVHDLPTSSCPKRHLNVCQTFVSVSDLKDVRTKRIRRTPLENCEKYLAEYRPSERKLAGEAKVAPIKTLHFFDVEYLLQHESGGSVSLVLSVSRFYLSR